MRRLARAAGRAVRPADHPRRGGPRPWACSHRL